jgi:hypothetical protein
VNSRLSKEGICAISRLFGDMVFEQAVNAPARREMMSGGCVCRINSSNRVCNAPLGVFQFGGAQVMSVACDVGDEEVSVFGFCT